MFGPSKLIQTYDEAVALIEAGDARLVTKTRYDAPEASVPLQNRLELDHAIYTAFAVDAERHVKSFVCGPFGNWDGTSEGMFYDGMCFGVLRQPFMDALQHHRDADGARWLWAFVTRWQSFMVLNPTVKVVSVWVVSDEDGVEHEFDSYEAMCEARDARPLTGIRRSGEVTRIRPV